MPLLAVLALATAVSAGPAASCDGNTREMEACLGGRLAKHEATLATYVAAARKRVQQAADAAPSGYSSVEKAIGGFDAAEVAWSKYREAACGAVYDYWSQGAIRGLNFLQCRILFTQRHAHTIWELWLTYPDGTPPILPEPPPATFP